MSRISVVSWILAGLLASVCYAPAAAQRPRLAAELSFDTWFDNRELKSEFSPDLTFFGMMITPELGLNWHGEQGWHRLMAGTNVTINFGDRRYRKNPEFIFYYNYTDKHFSVYAGVLPRRKAIGDYPHMFFSDSVRFYDTNIDGALFQYYGGRGYVELACDWLSMISDHDREKFVLFSSGRLNFFDRKLYAGYYASMFHHSVSYLDDGVVDNFLAYPYVGTNLEWGERHEKNYTFLDIKAGWVQAMQRDRSWDNKFRKPAGVQLEIHFEKRGFGIDNTLYLGDGLMPYYDRYGAGLYQGEPYYRTDHDIYNRLEVYWRPLRDSMKDLKISSVHHFDGKKWGWQQLIIFSIRLDRSTVNRL